MYRKMDIIKEARERRQKIGKQIIEDNTFGLKNMVQEHMMSDDFLEFVRKNKEPYDTLITYYRCAIMEIETKFRVLDQEFSLQYDRNPIESIQSRIKSDESLIKKIRSKGVEMSIESIEANIFDIAGVRVICSFPEDIYMLAQCFLKQDDITLIESKDYIENPKENGYRSLHLIVEVPIFLQNEKRPMKVEVQLRTIAMDFWASLEHKLRYKKNIAPEQAAQLAEELKECAEISAALDVRMQAIKHKIVPTQVNEKHCLPSIPEFVRDTRKNMIEAAQKRAMEIEKIAKKMESVQQDE